MKTLIAFLVILILFVVIRNGLPEGNTLQAKDVSLKATASRFDTALLRIVIGASAPVVEDHVFYKTSAIAGKKMIAMPYSGWRVM